MIKVILPCLILVFISRANPEPIPISVQSVLINDSLGSRSLVFEKWSKMNSIGYDSSEYEYIWSNEIYVYRKRNFEYQQCADFMCGLLKGNVDSLKAIYGDSKIYRVRIFHNVIGYSWVIKGNIGKIIWKPMPELEKDTTEIVTLERKGKFIGSMPVQVGWPCISEAEIKR